MQAGGMRNENVAINPIDNNAIKEANVRLGTNITPITEAKVESSYVAAQFGRPAAGGPVLGAAASRPGAWHADLFASLQNSVFNARTFFQSGPVKPSHNASYGGRATGALGKSTWLTFTGSQRKVRGMVNGNVLVPLASERTPRATDPAARAYVARLLAAYPAELPNRLDYDPRALNTNSPQRIDEIDGTARLDHDMGRWGKLSGFHQITRQYIDAFQLVAGQNPDNSFHTHRSQLAWRMAAGPRTDVALGFTFTRAKSVLTPEPNAVPMRTRVGFAIEELGPDSEFPVDRALSAFRYGGVVTHRTDGSRHELSFGADLTRYRHNGIETASSRGYMAFSANFGRSAIENLLVGTPSYYEITIGDLSRGYRRWAANAFFADRWKATPRLQVYWGLRYNLVTAPTEVHGYERDLYACDCNNFAPRLSLAWQMGGGWVMRPSYSVSFAEIPAVTYQQVRFNQPHVKFVQVQNPDLLHPLRDIDLNAPNLRVSPTYLAHNLVSPYEHVATLTLEHKLAAGSMLRFGYIGNRSLKNMNSYIMNRAVPVPGIPWTLDTVDQRRPDPAFYEIRWVVNGGIGTFNAGQASFDLPSWRGMRATATYTFSKAIDNGTDFTSTAANRDLSRSRAQSQYESLLDRKGLSNFDTTHSLLFNYSYDVPALARTGFAGALFRNWQIAGVALAKSGTPLTLYIGSDAPGFGNVDGGPSDRPNIVDPSILGKTISHPDVAPGILSRDKFAYIQAGQLRGSLGRNTFRKARIANWNAAATKQWHLVPRHEWMAQFRAEVYNLTNTPQFDEPQRNYSAPAFGKITNALNDGRVFQLGLRFTL